MFVEFPLSSTEAQRTKGTKFRLRFYSRVEKNGAVAKGRVGDDDTASRVAERGLLSHSYAVARMGGSDVTPSNDCCELLDRTDDEAAPQQPQNRWDAGTLLCCVDVTPRRASPFVVVSIAPQRRVGAIITALDLGASIDEAISAHHASRLAVILIASDGCCCCAREGSTGPPWVWCGVVWCGRQGAELCLLLYLDEPCD